MRYHSARSIEVSTGGAGVTMRVVGARAVIAHYGGKISALVLYMFPFLNVIRDEGGSLSW